MTGWTGEKVSVRDILCISVRLRQEKRRSHKWTYVAGCQSKVINNLMSDWRSGRDVKRGTTYRYNWGDSEWRRRRRGRMSRINSLHRWWRRLLVGDGEWSSEVRRKRADTMEARRKRKREREKKREREWKRIAVIIHTSHLSNRWEKGSALDVTSSALQLH